MLPSLATLEQFDPRVPGGVAASDEARAQANLDDASALVRAEAGKTWVDEANELDGVPDVIVTVTIAAAKRAFMNPDMVRSESIDGYSTSYAAASPDVYLTKAERQAVRRAAGRSGLWTQATTRLGTDEERDLPSVLANETLTASSEETDPFGAGWGS